MPAIAAPNFIMSMMIEILPYLLVFTFVINTLWYLISEELEYKRIIRSK